MRRTRDHAYESFDPLTGLTLTIDEEQRRHGWCFTGGGTTVNFPEPSAEERALQSEQVEILREQRAIVQEQVRQQELLAPFLFEEAGVTPVLDEEGRITAFERDPREAGLRERRVGIEEAFLSRTEAALAGELPVNPALERDLDEQEQLLREGLRKQLGPGFETSTPGIEALAKFEESRNILLEGARRGDLTLAEQFGLARETRNEIARGTNVAGVSGVAGLPLQGAGALGSTAAGFNQPLAQLFAARSGQNQANIAAQQNRSAEQAAIFGGVGQVAGTAGGIAIGKFL